MRYDVLIYPDMESGLYVAEVPDLPGCMSQGASFEEAQTNIREAIEGHVAVLHDLGRDIPTPSRHELVSVDVNIA